MGAFLDKPSLKTDVEFDSNDFFSYASCSMQGWRASQEDDQVCKPTLSEENLSALFAVFDGHGGSSVAKYCALNFPDELKKIKEFIGKSPNMPEALSKLYLDIDELLTKNEVRKTLEELSGAEDEESIEETTLEDREKEVNALCEEATAPIEEVVEKFTDSKDLPEETNALLEKRRKSMAPGQSKEKPSNKEESKTEEENDQSEDEDDSDYEPSEDEGDVTTFAELSEKLASKFQSEQVPGVTSGCTACTALLVPDLTTKGVRLFVANSGDTRAVLCRDGKAVDLSCDHKPELEAETKRVTEAGGVIKDGRINSGLNLSRAIGDHTYKLREDLPLAKQMISAEPDVTDTVLDANLDEFLIIACDGIWNVMTSQQVVDFIKARLTNPDLVGTQRKPHSDFVQDVDDMHMEDESDGDQSSNDEEDEDKKPADKNGESDEKPDKKDNEEQSEASEDEEESDDEESDEEDEEVEHRDGPGLLKEIARDLVHECLAPSTAGDGSGCDNMTCIIVKFNKLQDFAEKALVECGEVRKVDLPANDESEVLDRLKRFHSESSESDSDSEASSNEHEEPAAKKVKAHSNGHCENGNGDEAKKPEATSDSNEPTTVEAEVLPNGQA